MCFNSLDIEKDCIPAHNVWNPQIAKMKKLSLVESLVQTSWNIPKFQQNTLPTTMRVANSHHLRKILYLILSPFFNRLVLVSKLPPCMLKVVIQGDIIFSICFFFFLYATCCKHRTNMFDVVCLGSLFSLRKLKKQQHLFD